MVIASINVNSLLPHLDEIELLLKENGIHFLSLNETKIDDTLSDNLFKIEGYNFRRLDRNRHGGGVAFFCRDTFKCDIRNDIPKSNMEILCAQITPPRASPFIILSWYRPPNEPFETFDKLEQVLRFFETEGKELILLGDTNCDFCTETGCTNQSKSPVPGHTKRLKDLYQSFGLTQLISEPTRETENTSTLIDHIAVSNTNNIVESGVVKTAISDHYVVYSVRKYQGAIKNNHKHIHTRQLKNFNKEAFLADLAAVNWSAILVCSDDINVIVEQFMKILSLAVEKHAPSIERRVSERYSPWLSSDLKALFRTRDRMKIAAVKAKSELLMNAYRHVRNQANNMNSRLKRNYFTNKLNECEGDLKQTWSTINKLINKRSKSTQIQSLKVDDTVIKDSESIANLMNDYFCSIGDKLSKKIPDKENSLLKGEYDINPTSACFTFSPMQPQELVKAMNKFKTSHGSGLDGISSFFLKAGMPILAQPLSQLFNLSLSLGLFPDSWKIARVAPIFKDGPADESNNYRPISVLPVVSRLFEKLIYDQVYHYLDSNKLIFGKQSAYRRLHYVLSCLLKCTNDWYLNLEGGKYTAVTFVDLKKAIDTVNHKILLQKLELYGMRNKELKWFRSYLTDRKQCCKVNGKLSNIESITCGVPQGSCLGPLLFIIYINDLHLHMKHSDVNMYADDTSLMFASDSIAHINDCINDDLSYLKSWLQANKLSLNVAKTNSLVVGSRKRLKDISDDRAAKPYFVVGEENVSVVENIKYLGVIVDKYLSWDEQISAVTKKVSRGLGMLRFSKKYLPIVTVQKMYRSLVEPYFRYSCPVWGVSGINAISRLQKLQNRAARIVTNSAYDASALPIIRKLGWPTVNELIESETLKMVYKSVNGLAPTYLTEMFARMSDTCKRELRNTKTDLAVPLRKSSFGQKCFSYKGAKLWNDLSVEVKSSKTYEIFKKRLGNSNVER